MGLLSRFGKSEKVSVVGSPQRTLMVVCFFSSGLCGSAQGDSMRTNIQLDFGDGTAVSYSNLSWTEDGIRHVYKSAGIFRVTALAENTLGYDSTTLFLHVTCRPMSHL